MAIVREFSVCPLPMVTKDGRQRVDITYCCAKAIHLVLDVLRDGETVVSEKVVFNGGRGTVDVLLPAQENSFEALWRLTDLQGIVQGEVKARWTAPRHRTIYVMVSSHTDMGLHNSHYVQKHRSVELLDAAIELCDATQDREEEDRYRYTMEGTWYWNNYGQEKGEEAARAVVRDYIKTGKLGICCGIAGNHFQTFGQEELCRAAGERRRLLEAWGLDSRPMALIDINGFPMSIIQPYSEAGVENIIFAPNHWNPLPSTVWKMDMTKEGMYLNPDASGGGSRVDVRYESDLPLVFYWEDANQNRLLVWASTQYGYGGAPFGLMPNSKFVPETVPTMETCMAKHLPLMEEKYPYDVWLLCCYDDDQVPNADVTDSIAAWNAKWAWPRLRTLGDPDEPFRILKEKHGDQIPVLRGEITGGWYQHPTTVAELLARKFEADRLLARAEKWTAAAGILDENYGYPTVDFRRAWDHLLFNDEHSYGVSGYQGRRVYETWLQNRDWIDKAEATARGENASALAAIAAHIPADEPSVAVFNPTARDRRELVEREDGKFALVDVPAFGYRVVKESGLRDGAKTVSNPGQPPVVENDYYRIAFAENGAMESIFDKGQGRELLDGGCEFRANELVYTRDNHKTFLIPEKAEFTVISQPEKTTVVVKTAQKELGAELIQEISLPHYEKRIDIDNRIYHAKDMFNKRRYHRYLYFAFPFAVENSRRLCHLNGNVAEYAVDLTGHSTDTYMAANEWCCAENDHHGVALLMRDSQLMEFDHIHPDKTDFGNAGMGSQMFSYVATDWLQMHLSGGSHLDYRFRYAITSYEGGYQKAGVPETAERYVNPVQSVSIPAQSGTLPGDAHSFLRVVSGQRFIALKRADDGDGIVARLYGQGAAEIKSGFGMELSSRRVRIDETPLEGTVSAAGYATYRLTGVDLKERKPVILTGENGAPAPIGSVYTGLVTEPCAVAGEHPGHLYLEWGRSMEEDFSHYELYRSEIPGFTADEATFVANIHQEPEYVVGRYSDMGLKEHTRYYYRVRAVNKAGRRSVLSREFGAYTRESI